MWLPILMVGDVEKITKKKLKWAGVFQQKNDPLAYFSSGRLVVFVGTCIKGERLTGKMLAIAKQQRECPPATKKSLLKSRRKIVTNHQLNRTSLNS